MASSLPEGLIAEQWKLLDAYWSAATAVLFDTETPTAPSSVATGTFMRTPGEKVVVLTAAHNIGRAPLSLGYVGVDARSLPDFWSSGWTHPQEDVAMLVLKDEHAPRFRDRALPPECIAEQAHLDSPGIIAIAGLPAALHARPVQPADDHVFGALIYRTTTTETVRDDRGLLAIPWSDAVWNADGSRFGYAPGAIQPLPHPEGISGGAVWLYSPTGSALWTPASTSRIVGIARSYCEKTRREFAVPSESWRGWFSETLEKVDRGLSPHE